MDDGEFIANIISAKDTDESPTAQISLKDADNNSIAGFARLGSGGNAHIGQLILKDNANLKVNLRASGNSYFNGTSAQVGIGNDSPGKELDVTGEIRASGDITANGNIVGDGATDISGINTIIAIGHISTSGDLHTEDDIFMKGANSVIFMNDPTEGLIANSDGSIKINASAANPSATNHLVVSSSGGTATANARVAIGGMPDTTNLLTVYGNISASGTLHGTDLFISNKEYLDYHSKYSEKYGKKTIVLMMVGQFYEIYAVINDEIHIGPDLNEISDILNIQIAKRNKKIQEIDFNNFLMAGFPDHALIKFRNILLNHNYTIILVDQITPKPNPERDVVEIISPGTILDSYNKQDTNYLLSL